MSLGNLEPGETIEHKRVNPYEPEDISDTPSQLPKCNLLGHHRLPNSHKTFLNSPLIRTLHMVMITLSPPIYNSYRYKKDENKACWHYNSEGFWYWLLHNDCSTDYFLMDYYVPWKEAYRNFELMLAYSQYIYTCRSMYILAWFNTMQYPKKFGTYASFQGF